MNANIPALAYAGYGFLIILYAWTRSTSATELGFVLLVYVVFGHLVAAGLADVPAQHGVGPMATSNVLPSHFFAITSAKMRCCRSGFGRSKVLAAMR